MRGTADLAAEAARVAQVGYTAVIDRMTPELTLATIAANVRRSVTNADGAPATDSELSNVWSPAWNEDGVTVFDERQKKGAIGTAGTFAFGITVQVDGEPGSIAATAVLHNPSDSLRASASALSTALDAALQAIRTGTTGTAASVAFDESVGGHTGFTAPPTLHGLGKVAGTRAALLGPGAISETVLREGAVMALLAHGTTPEGAIVFQTTVRVTGNGADRLDTVPLRLIELR